VEELDTAIAGVDPEQARFDAAGNGEADAESMSEPMTRGWRFREAALEKHRQPREDEAESRHSPPARTAGLQGRRDEPRRQQKDTRANANQVMPTTP
jgi:hypothetical protein